MACEYFSRVTAMLECYCIGIVDWDLSC